jgi:hypothetical protein
VTIEVDVNREGDVAKVQTIAVTARHGAKVKDARRRARVKIARPAMTAIAKNGVVAAEDVVVRVADAGGVGVTKVNVAMSAVETKAASEPGKRAAAGRRVGDVATSRGVASVKNDPEGARIVGAGTSRKSVSSMSRN